MGNDSLEHDRNRVNLFGIGMVRNEADIVELWVRYNLKLLDALIVIDHRSEDNTPQILESLRCEGLQISIHQWADHSYSQAEAMSATVRPYLGRREAAYFVPLDADELLIATRDELIQSLLGLPEGHVGAIPWRTFLPEVEQKGNFFFRNMCRYRALEAAGNIKVIASAELLERGRWGPGSHVFCEDSEGTFLPTKLLPFYLAHFPVRNLRQLLTKVSLGALSSRIKDPRKRIYGESWHWLELENRTASLLETAKGDELDESSVNFANSLKLMNELAIGYANMLDKASQAKQKVLKGAVPDFPDITQRYEPKVLSLDQVRHIKATTKQRYVNTLNEIGVFEFNTANAAWRKSEWVEALQWYKQAARLNPSLANAHLGMARCFVKLADWPEAREAFAACLRLDPEQYSAWLEAGHLCRQMGQFSQALGAYKRATEVSPNRYEAYFALGRLLPEMGEPLQGEQAFERSMDCLLASKEPTAIWRQAEALHRMGQYRLEQGDAKQALVLLQRGLSLLAAIEKPVQSQTIASGARQQDLDDLRVEMHIDLGDAYWRLGQKPMAFKAFTLASASHSEVSLSRLGALSFRLNLWQEAIQVLQRNVALHPKRLTARWNLAHLLAECWQMDAAETALREAEAIGPVPGAKSLRASMAGRRGDADRALQLYQECAADAAEHGAFASAAAMSSLYSDQLSAEEVAQLHRRLFRSLGEGAKASADFKYPSHKGRRLKLGMVTADFHHQHPVNLFMQPVLRALDRDRIELFVYFNGVSYDEQTRLAMQRAEHWLECATLNDVQLAKHIEADQIDLLLDLAGHTGQHRMRLFAQRAAPVQATYLGYPGSTGVPNIDWILGDAIVTPKGHESLYSEKIWRLPELVFCFSPEDDYPMDGLFNRKSDNMITFGSFNNVPKLTPKTLTLWARILRAVPDSKLLLKAPSFTDAGAVKLFQARLSQLGVDLQRVEFRGPTGLADMMQEYHDVDIALDPIPYNGGTTSLQALWMGVPVVVLEGAHFVSRMGASFMTAARLPEWIAEDEDDYVRIAAQMAMDRPKLKELKRGLRARLQALPGWDPARQTRSLEEAFVGMCHQNLKPR